MSGDERTFLALVAVGVFFVDRDGKVWREKRLRGKGRWERMKAATRAETSSSRNYPTIIFRDGVQPKPRRVYAHRVVWAVRVGGRLVPEGMIVNHRNGDRRDSRPENLELVTASENVRHGVEKLGGRRLRGEQHPGSKLTDRQVDEIRAAAGFGSYAVLAAAYAVSVSTISAIRRGTRRKKF